jgi:spermidine synthase
MAVTVIQIGLDPEVIDYSSADFAQFSGLTEERLRAANDDNVAALRAAGYHVDNCLIDFANAGADKARRLLQANRYDAVLIGAGVRLVASNTLLFESIVNAAHITQPGCRFVFNRGAQSTPDNIRRWYPTALAR